MVQKSVGCSAHREEQAKSVPRWGLWDGGFRSWLRQSALVGGEDAQTPSSASLSCVCRWLFGDCMCRRVSTDAMGGLNGKGLQGGGCCMGQ